MGTMSDEEFERRSAEILARRREGDEYMIRRIEELREQQHAREEYERRRAERRQRLLRFVPFLR
jgi:hypothetical protein